MVSAAFSKAQKLSRHFWSIKMAGTHFDRKLTHLFNIGYVFEAFDRTHKQTVAVKRTTKAGEYVSREFEVLDRLRECKNVIKLLDIYYSKNEEGKTA